MSKSKLNGRCFFTGLIIILIYLAIPKQADAAPLEVSAGFYYNRTNYSANDYTWSRRWTASVGYYFIETGSLEWDFQDVFEHDKVGIDDLSFHDQIYSLNWVQSLTGKTSPIQPYFKVGVALLNRDAGGTSAITQMDEESAVLGAGMRIFLTRSFAIRIECTTYIEKLQIKTWKDNVGITFGTSVYF